jgi:methyl-accepting chemotaxis protein
MKSTLRTKILLAYLFGTVVVLIGAAVGGFGLTSSLSSYRHEVADLNAARVAALELEVRFKTQVQEWKDVLLRGKDPAKREKYWRAFEKEEREVSRLAGELSAQLPNGKARSLVLNFAAAHRTLGDGYRKGLSAFNEAGADAVAGDHAVAGIDREPADLLGQAVAEIGRLSQAAGAEADERANTSLVLGFVIMAVMLAGGMAMFAAMIQKSIVSPAKALVDELERLSGGSLGKPIRSEATGEFGQFALSAETMRAHLVDLIGKAKHASSSVAACTGELHVAADGILTGIDRSSESAATLAAAMEQVHAAIEHVADDAEMVAAKAGEAHRHAAHGKQVVTSLIEEMRDVEVALSDSRAAVGEFVQSARSIATLTQKVKEIADQTNLLALNATIEAARAGEQGRGFAVVADEVRKLAEKSAESAREIEAVTTSLAQRTETVEQAIADGNRRLTANTAHSDSVSQALEDAIGSVEAANQGVASIAAAIQESRGAIAGVAAQSEEVARSAEENAAAVRQIQDNAARMTTSSSELAQSLAAFSTAA